MQTAQNSTNAGGDPNSLLNNPPPPIVDVQFVYASGGSELSYHEPPPPDFYEELSAGGAAAEYQFRTGSRIPQCCVRCGQDNTGDDLIERDFSRDYTPPWAYATMLLGPVVSTLIIMWLRKEHKMKGMFCQPCNSKYTKGVLLYGGSMLLFLVTFLGGLYIASTPARRNTGFAILAVGALASFVLSRYSRRFGPKYSKVSRKQVFVNIPNIGDVEFTNSAK